MTRPCARVPRRRLSARTIALGALALLAVLPDAGNAAPASLRVDPVILPATAAYARTPGCPTVRLSIPLAPHSDPAGDLVCPRPQDMPLSQGESYICFAYATADMISQRIGDVVSPLDVATKYFFADPAEVARGRSQAWNAARALVAADRLRIRLDRSDVDIYRGGNAAGRPYFDKLQGGEEDVSALLYNAGGYCRDVDLPSYDGYLHMRRFFRRQRVKWSIVTPPRLCYRTIGSAPRGLHSPRADAFNDAWVRYTDRVCRRRPLPVPLLPVADRIAPDRAAVMRRLKAGERPPRRRLDRLFAMIDYALDHGRAPAVGYTYWVYEQRPDDDPDVTADHSSVIIGRREANGSCQYRVQDNVGEYCSAMYPAIRARCRNGRIWLTEQELRSAIYSVVYLR